MESSNTTYIQTKFKHNTFETRWYRGGRRSASVMIRRNNINLTSHQMRNSRSVHLSTGEICNIEEEKLQRIPKDCIRCCQARHFVMVQFFLCNSVDRQLDPIWELNMQTFFVHSNTICGIIINSFCLLQ